MDEILVRLFTVCDKRLEIAPSSDRWVFTVLMAVSIALMAVRAFEELLIDGPATCRTVSLIDYKTI